MGARAGTAGITAPAIVWRRIDFRESSRIVTLLLREHGKLPALAKGAHRPDSPLLGRLDFLNEVQVRLSPDRGGLRLLLRAELVRERRPLRACRRFLAASHFAGLCDAGLPPERADPALFDLLSGGLNLIERCPEAALPIVVLGLEVRLLAHHGALPDLDRCGSCGSPLTGGTSQGESGSLVCRRHAGRPRRAVPAAALTCLRTLRDTPGRGWPELHLPLPDAAVRLAGTWLAAALELRAPLRARLFAVPRVGPAVQRPA